MLYHALQGKYVLLATAHAPLTAGQLEPAVDEDGVAGGGPGAEDAALLQHHLRVQGPPAARALLG